MRRLLAQQDGIALVTSLCLTLISLTIVLSVMYMITQGLQQTGANKRYKTALEASYGGTDILMKEIVPQVLQNITATSAELKTSLEGSYNMLSLAVLADPQCLKNKLTLGTESWGTACDQLINPKNSADMKFQLPSTGGQPYVVYTKIVDTVFGNSDTSGLQLEGAGVAESTSVITPQHVPYIYRVEIQAEKATNATEQANMSVLYAY